MSQDQYISRSALALERIAIALEKLLAIQSTQEAEPNFVRPLSEYRSFQWSSIGASVIQADPDGPTHLEYGGYTWTRRSPSNKFAPAIWYSRANGRDENGDVKYLRLITFKEMGDADALPEKARSRAGEANGNGHSAPPPPPPPEAELKPISATDYYKRAPRFGLTNQEASDIARLFEVPVSLSHTGHVNFARPNLFLQYFGKAKKNGFAFIVALEILKECLFDVDDAAQRLTSTGQPES